MLKTNVLILDKERTGYMLQEDLTSQFEFASISAIWIDNFFNNFVWFIT